MRDQLASAICLLMPVINRRGLILHAVCVCMSLLVYALLYYIVYIYRDHSILYHCRILLSV